MIITETKVRVRYAETDKMGVVYYGNYAMYYEVGRTEALRQIGITYRSLEENGVMMPVISMSCRYIKSALYDDELTIRTKMHEITGVRVNIEYEILNEAGELINTGDTTLVFVDMQTNKLTRCPEALSAKMKPHFKA